MSPPHVLVLTCDDDPHADHVRRLLDRRGARTTVFDNRDYLLRAHVELAYTARGLARRLLHTESGTLDLDSLTALWWRRPGWPEAHPAITDPSVAEYAVREGVHLISDLWEHLTCRMVPARESVFQRAEHKPSQLTLAAELGFEIPETLIATQADALWDFHNRHDGRIVTKTLGLPRVENLAAGHTVIRKCDFVSARDLAYAEALRFCPVIVQEYVPKRLELRVTVVGRRVFAAEIHSQDSNRAMVDWRRYDLGGTPHLVHRLPDEVAERCLAMTDRLGLSYGAFDLVLTPDDRYVFLEINPNGQWLWIEELTGLPISEAVCDLLLEGA
ncbi:glutathione synthase/RimK-type ligase-like ATP-grasp enzyme [Streptosporangium becharense]|uniref:Glutathione synthase/RimK-type ligase-like ATP-grasp enzyme n=1 Tax=Streptosporangium becharense TaxID=1816182 RepID=A0A7W9IKB7_9ACTN|nr:ATP-dependent carboxylate-amine ligase [Streptosporangium becharense]MBB2911293.1 glutathione synthase/RimK-type ligase-like ATP-grasp enzyme [Streptosporangium becharense]MBB5821649.1 glutathione synthase/RimK-type ligase-like ATP-grasp enzyme [Streptosporangium becharense]